MVWVLLARAGQLPDSKHNSCSKPFIIQDPPMTQTKGHCLCGQISFSYTGDPKWVLHCHCETCRRATSSPMATWISVPDENFAYTSGTPSQYSSSPEVIREFCPNCGTPMSFRTQKMPGEIHLYAVSLEDPNSVSPSCHVFEAEKLGWFDVHDDLPRYATTRMGGKADPTHRGPRMK